MTETLAPEEPKKKSGVFERAFLIDVTDLKVGMEFAFFKKSDRTPPDISSTRNEKIEKIDVCNHKFRRGLHVNGRYCWDDPEKAKVFITRASATKFGLLDEGQLDQ